MEYIGEHLWAGQLGNLFVIVSFVAVVLSTFSYFKSAGDSEHSESWKNLGKLSFRVHSIAVLGIVGMLFFMLINNYFEYHYIWHHSSKALPLRYVFSAFWEGQEGSFILWSFWHVILGNLLIRSAKNWESTVMTVFSSVQIFLSSMILGVVIIDYKLGSNPFTVLLREHTQFQNIPLFSNANYLEKLDGRGLNPLLQNYWMTIHPPTLFLGFASTLVPFSYAIAGLWKRDYQGWIKPVLPWTIFGVMILGIGILMGGAWAYEALSFGGFWAWDPVENASLVPWITFVGALHVMHVQKARGNAAATAFAMTIFTFVLVLYSTFLTRSGVLGESSVHAFTDLGMYGQLLLYLLFFFGLGLVMFFINLKKFPKAEDDAFSSREFWMFVGTLVLALSAIHITIMTSKPIINLLFGTKMALDIGAQERFDIYHSFQIPVVIVITCMMAFAQFLKYKKSDGKAVIRKLTVASGIAVIITGAFIYAFDYTNPYYILMLFTAVFALTANFDYMLRILKGKINKAGSSIAHIGFALIMIGALLSTSKSIVISENTSTVDLSSLGKLKNNENILLYKNDTVQLSDYYVTFTGKRKEGVNIFYNVEYMKKVDGEFITEFTLSPRIQLNPRMGNVAEPDTRHFLYKDIYTHVTYADLSMPEDTDPDEYGELATREMEVGESFFTSNFKYQLDSVYVNNKVALDSVNDSTRIEVIAEFSIINKAGDTVKASPMYVIENMESGKVFSMPHELKETGVILSLNKIIPEENKYEISVREKNRVKKDFMVMKAIQFPMINIL
ncbi:MAG: cytochrome c biogenesis protein CcsA, partial [Flavobacteriales bacterium]|nr:cytochrome c biogenesis protein CcsA [Flavobacteriales bacterium]